MRRLVSTVPVLIVYLAAVLIFTSWPVDGARWAWHHLSLDDSWIHLAYAQNLLRYGYFTYNPGAVETGASSPLWVLLLAIGLAATHNPIFAAKFIGMLLGGAAVGLSFIELRAIAGRAAAWAGALMLAVEPMWLMSAGSGMEITLAGFLLVWLIRTIRLAQPWRAGLAMGLLILARPEMVLPAMAGGVLLLAARGVGEKTQGWRGAWARGWRAALGTFLVAFPWFLYCRLGTGHWLPNTFYVKATRGPYGGWEKLQIMRWLVSLNIWPSPFIHDPLALVFLALGVGWAIAQAGQRPAALAWVLLPLAHLVAWTIITPERVNIQTGGLYMSFTLLRYRLPAYPAWLGCVALGVGVGAAGLRALSRRFRSGLRPAADRWLRRTLGGGVAVALAAANYFGWWNIIGPFWTFGPSLDMVWPYEARNNALECEDINNLQETAGRWIAANLPPDAVIATQDAGAVRYYTRNPLIDLVGLNSHAFCFAPDRQAYLTQHHVRYLVVFPRTTFTPPRYGLQTRAVKGFESMRGGISLDNYLAVEQVLAP